ncbi:hypothetical protein LOK49_LG06G00319 [Camellia lanceoleosa]|uniref:Uncharacterized protein n=1 Tax=Camellia lanceoleosa TaxID=1840588 RepID=A0ACC0HE42_9ERIC|nr:hypothetical protein LOK49_LG06G00319 [Camellia lanceoleosa]
MTTLEKLFVQIFDRKNRIIEQVNQRSDLYTRHLVSKLLIDGITPPSWLWNPKFDSQSSDPKAFPSWLAIASVGTGKRDIKVKALEAAEAAKRLEEKRQNERKMKKDALKLERERKEQENLRQMEINKKKKEEEQKKKDADMAARKRLREEEERKEKERKRKRIEEPQQQQRGKEEKLRAGKEKEVPFGAMDENVNDGKESNNELRKHQKMKKPQTDPRAAEISTSNASQVILEDCQAFSHFGDNGEPTSVFTKTAEKDSFMAKTSLEKSYSISPYQCSDDEEDEQDERDEIRTKKFVPSWASKNSVALVLSSQQKVDPYIRFPPESFCSIDEAENSDSGFAKLFQNTSTFYCGTWKSVPNGLLEHMDVRSTLNLDDDGGKQLKASYSCVDEVKCAFEGVLYSDCVPYTDARCGWSFKKPYMSPIGKLWDRISSNSSSSGKQRSLNPELTCFPIEEDPSTSGENENIDEVADTIQEDISSTLMTRAKRQPLAEIKEACVNPPTSVSAAERFPDRNSLDSTNTEVSATGAQSRIKQKLGNHYSNKRRCTNEAKENRSLSVSTNCIKKATESLNNRFSKPKLSGKTSLRKAGQNLLERESKRNNIVSNITSFLPLVQQKQAAAVGTDQDILRHFVGKRDIKVKALEAAEAAKRLEEKRQNERKMKKDALKHERERKEQENLRQMEINKKKKEEEQKKKDADMAARKRLREEEERKEKERKRKRIEEPRQQQRGKEEKLRAGKEKEVSFGAMDENVNDGKESNNELRKHQKMKKPQTDPRAAEISTSNASQVILEDCQAFCHFGDDGEPTSVFTKTAEKDSFMAKTSLEKSYSISPYQCLDDEEDEEDERDEIRTKKFVPSWASKNSVALVLSSQQKVDPYIIFPPESFCSIDEAKNSDSGFAKLFQNTSTFYCGTWKVQLVKANCISNNMWLFILFRISSNSSSSGKQSLNPEPTCFPIEEDPSISGENENIDEVADTIQEDISSTLMTRAKRQPLAEIKEACVNPPTSVSAAERFPDRNSLDSTNTEVSATGAQSRIKQKLGNRYSNKRRCTNEAKENRSLSVSTNCIKKATESLNNRFSKPKLSGKTSLRKAGQNLLERESKRNNIVSNITSFLPLVQQKQAAAVGTGKRDIKVKALEAAEAAKRLEEKRQNERKMKKDALKHERERKEQENLRQMEINKKKKEEEQK